MRYLLDTNIVSDIMRHPNGKVAARIRDVGETQIGISIVVAAELRYGIAKKGSIRLTDRLETILAAIVVLPFEAPADVEYGVLRARVERAGSPIGGNDLLIASHALALGAILVTDNESEFSRIAGLSCENWLR